MILIAEHDIGLYLQIATTVLVALIIPGCIRLIIWINKLVVWITKLDMKLNNGISNEIQSLRREVMSQREDFGNSIHALDIKLARQEGDSGIHSP